MEGLNSRDGMQAHSSTGRAQDRSSEWSRGRGGGGSWREHDRGEGRTKCSRNIRSSGPNSKAVAVGLPRSTATARCALAALAGARAEFNTKRRAVDRPRCLYRGSPPSTGRKGTAQKSRHMRASSFKAQATTTPPTSPPPGCIVWSDGTIYGLFPTLRILPAGSRTHAPKSLSYLPIGTKGVL